MAVITNPGEHLFRHKHNKLKNREWSKAGHTIDADMVPVASGLYSIGEFDTPFSDGVFSNIYIVEDGKIGCIDHGDSYPYIHFDRSGMDLIYNIPDNLNARHSFRVGGYEVTSILGAGTLHTYFGAQVADTFRVSPAGLAHYSSRYVETTHDDSDGLIESSYGNLYLDAATDLIAKTNLHPNASGTLGIGTQAETFAAGYFDNLEAGTSIYTKALQVGTANCNTIQVGDIATYIQKDGSNNLTFTDAVTGTRTLKNIGCPVYHFIKATAQSEGDLHLSGVNWGVSKVLINIIRIETSSTDWDLYILQNDNGYAADDANIPKMQLVEAGDGDVDIFVNLPYQDEDDSSEVHLYYLDNSGSNTADIYIIGTELI